MDMFQWLINLLIISNTELAEELHKLVIRKVHLCVTDNIWVADLADMILMSKFNKGFNINMHGLFRCTIITNTFQTILNESNRKPNKI